MTNFLRPKNLKFPQIYYTFKARNKNSDELVKYRIQDLPVEDYEVALDLLITDFVPDENLCHCRDIESDAVGLREIREFWANELKKKISIACYKNNDDENEGELIGLNVLAVVSKNDAEESTDDVSLKIQIYSPKIILKFFSLKVSHLETFSLPYTTLPTNIMFLRNMA